MGEFGTWLLAVFGGIFGLIVLYDVFKNPGVLQGIFTASSTLVMGETKLLEAR